MPQKQKLSNISENELDRLIDEAVNEFGSDQLRPDDWTIARMVKEKNVTEDQARRIVRKLIASGKVFAVRVRNPSGRGSPLMAYRLVE